MTLLTRRSLIKLAGTTGLLALSGVSVPVIGQGRTQVSFTTSWLPEGPNLFAYIALYKGFWKKLGLDVSIKQGTGSSTAVQAVASESFMFGMAVAPTVMFEALQGLPIISIGQLNYDALMGVVVLKSTSIRLPKDLEGRKLGVSVRSGEYPFLPLYAKRAGFDLDKVTLVPLSAQERDRALIDKRVDAVAAFGSSTIPALLSNGIAMRFLSFKDVGLEFYGQSLITKTSRVAADPALCQAFVTGAMQAIQFVLTEPDEALAIFAMVNEKVSLTPYGKDYARLGLGLTNLSNLVPEALEHGLGYADPLKMHAQTQRVIEFAAGQGAKPPAMDSLFTNQFVGQVKLTDQQILKAQQVVKGYRKYLD